MKKLLTLCLLMLGLISSSNAITWNVTVNDGGWGNPATANTMAWAIAQFNAAGAGNHVINIAITTNSLTDPAKWNLNNAAANLTIAGNNSTIDGPGYGSWGITLNRITINNWSITNGFGTTATNVAGAGGHVISGSLINNVMWNFTTANNLLQNSTIGGPGGTFRTTFNAATNTIIGTTFNQMELRFNGSTNNWVQNNRFINTSFVNVLAGSNNNQFYGNWFNLNAAGTGLTANTNSFSMTIDASTGNTIGGNAPWKRNVFGLVSTNALVIQAGSANTRVNSNYFGTDRNGTVRLTSAGTNSTILLRASQNVSIDSNVVSSAQNSTGGAIEVNAGNCDGLLIRYNNIGLDANGNGLPSGNASGFGNNNTGIFVSAGSIDNAIISRNAIAAGGSNAYGIQIAVASTGVTINNNIVGLQRSGIYNSLNDVGNGQSGILFTGAVTNLLIFSNTVARNGILTGGSCSAQQQSCGIIFQAAAVNSATISGNNIGVDVSRNPAGNQFAGLYFFNNGNMGGSNINNVLVSNNILGDNGNCSALSSHGFASYQANYFTFTNNYVGVGPSGENIGNYASGIEVNTANNFRITNNTIANNKGRRISAQAEACAGIALFTGTFGTITGNNIYNQANAGGSFISNNGIFVQRGGNILIGGATGANNIYSNGTHGIVVFDGADYVQMYNNSIYCNGAKGINIGCSGGFAGKSAGNASFGCGTITLNTFTPPVTTVSGGRPANSNVYVYSTTLCASSCTSNPQGQTLVTGGTTSYPSGATWQYIHTGTINGFVTALALGTGADCSGGVCRTSEYSTCVTNTVLNIQTLDLQASKLGSDKSSLKWWVRANKQFVAYILERSFDGSAYNEIQRVEASSNAKSDNNYNYTDSPNANGMVFYRVKAVDANGEAYYSSPKAILFEGNDNIRIFPNPSQGTFQIVGLEGNENEIEVFNTLGQKVYEQANDIQVVTTGLPSGTYLLQIKSNNQVRKEVIVIE